MIGYCQAGARLFGGEREILSCVVDHQAHLADASRALHRTLVVNEDVSRPVGTGLDGKSDVTLAKAIAIADVHGGPLLNKADNGSL